MAPKLIKPKSQTDIIRNRLAVAEYIRGLADAARRIAEEEKPRPTGPVQMRLPFEYYDPRIIALLSPKRKGKRG